MSAKLHHILDLTFHKHFEESFFEKNKNNFLNFETNPYQAMKTKVTTQSAIQQNPVGR